MKNMKNIKNINRNRKFKELNEDYDSELINLQRQLVDLRRSRDEKYENIFKQYGLYPHYTTVLMEDSKFNYRGVENGQLLCDNGFIYCNPDIGEIDAVLPYNGDITVDFLKHAIQPFICSSMGLCYSCKRLEDVLGLKSKTITQWLIDNNYISKIGMKVNKKGRTSAYYFAKGMLGTKIELTLTEIGLDLLVKNLDEIRELK